MSSFNVNYTGGFFLSHTHTRPVRCLLDPLGLFAKPTEKKKKTFVRSSSHLFMFIRNILKIHCHINYPDN